MLTRVQQLLQSAVRSREERGQGLAEYGLILALVAVALVGALTALALGISGGFDDITAALP